MSLRHIADSRYAEWESAVIRFIRTATTAHDYGVVEVAKAQLLKGMHLKEELDDPDVEDRERLALIEDLKSSTAQRLDQALHTPAFRNRTAM